MQFFKLSGLITNQTIAKQLGDSQFSATILEDINLKSNDYYTNFEEKLFFFVNKISGDTITFGICSSEILDVKAQIDSFLEKLDFNLQNIQLEEITSGKMLDMIQSAHDSKYISNDNEIINQFGLNWVENFTQSYIFEEDIIDEVSKEELYEKSALLTSKETLIPELDRIYAVSSNSTNLGHPVHYMILSDTPSTSIKTCDILLQALHANNRVSNKRYSTINLYRDSETFMDSDCIDSIYTANIGGAVVIKYVDRALSYDLFNRSIDEDIDVPLRRSRRPINAFDSLCENIKRYRNKVLTILCLPRENMVLKNSYFKSLNKTVFIELKEKLIVDDKAKDYLLSLANSSNVPTDHILLNTIESGKEYHSHELKSIFDEWYDNRLRSVVFPQYNQASLSATDSKSSYNGNAYRQLTELIGLSSAKDLILKAINFHKAQKLFANKGMKAGSHSMHMIFTGNPGTAKTTVARLFSQILQENGILSKGHLVECGRVDLVAKIVGGTAIKVQTKFQEAKGGVLFIDEAYSLVDDRDGLFGDEAITTIVQEMENNRKDVVVIFAGYPDKMEDFLLKNPGLRSRIAHHIHFPDYDTDTLLKIAKLVAKQKDLILSEGALEKLEGIFDQAQNDRDFGNGRYVRNIIEQAEMNRASRLVEMDQYLVTEEDVKTILPEDIEMPAIAKEAKDASDPKIKVLQEDRTIGF